MIQEASSINGALDGAHRSVIKKASLVDASILVDAHIGWLVERLSVLVSLLEQLRVVYCFAKRARIIILAPLFDALAVEVVAFVAW